MIICLFYFLSVPFQVCADSLQDQLKKYQQQADQLNSQLNNEKQQTSALNTKILSLQQSIQTLDEAVAGLQTNLAEQQKQLQDLENKQAKLEKQRQQQVTELGSFLRNYYENGGAISFLEVLFQSSSWTNLLDRWENVCAVVNASDQLQKDILASSQNITDQQVLIKQKTVSIQSMIQGKEKMQKSQQQVLANQQDTLTQLSVQEKTTLAAAITAQSHVSAVEELIKEQALEAALVAKGKKAGINPSSTNSRGSISVPVTIPSGVEPVLAYAEQFLGTPYVWGGTSAPPGFDCSGYVQHVFKHFGIQLNRIAADQYREGIPIPKSGLKPGDLLFFTTYEPGASHVGIYIGNNIMIDAGARGVAYNNITNSYWTPRYLGARRIISD
jgi:cell wall-associated NlpC family hydrolase